MRFSCLLAVTGAVVFGACAQSMEPPSGGSLLPVSVHPERRGIGLIPLDATALETSEEKAYVVDPRRSLVVTDEVILARFSFEEVMQQLVAQSKVAKLTPLQLYQEWWDTQRRSPGLGLGGSHCDDQPLGDGTSSLNGFSYACPRTEGNQAKEDPFLSPGTNLAAYVPIGLINRFDLAAKDGSDCGEYRIIFARRSGLTQSNNRNLIAFESVLPNPNPKKGLKGCQDVALFWAKLSKESNAQERADDLHDFYFKGYKDFPPALHIDNLGNAQNRTTGQVRTNQFMQALWTLREFRVRKQCVGKTCALRFVPDTVKGSPAGVLFSVKTSHGRQEDFAQFLTSRMETLAIGDLFRFDLASDERFNSGQSRSSGTDDLYSFQMGKGASPLRTRIQASLDALGSSLTPNQIVARAQVLSCSGCHQFSTGMNLGGGLIWPTKSSSFEFVHVSERTHEMGPDGRRYAISEALEGVFMPQRKQVLEAYLNGAASFQLLPGMSAERGDGED
ncbi:hypothetical protein [Melittangium boletus]|uniref:Cytochrome c domain-containing protein n=1 Tax=Melittangium boletus DSM 14713 TaxID=1294270 RepID=A0A250IFZ0_9BACT|nr:hypothetical protein [Melittangium boletus]ATB30744.1 hypothetical protein MEBOL_004205 [Melittangium boletus DSM 14713]